MATELQVYANDPVADSDSFSLKCADSEKSIWSHSSVSALAAADQPATNIFEQKSRRPKKTEHGSTLSTLGTARSLLVQAAATTLW